MITPRIDAGAVEWTQKDPASFLNPANRFISHDVLGLVSDFLIHSDEPRPLKAKHITPLMPYIGATHKFQKESSPTCHDIVFLNKLIEGSFVGAVIEQRKNSVMQLISDFRHVQFNLDTNNIQNKKNCIQQKSVLIINIPIIQPT